VTRRNAYILGKIIHKVKVWTYPQLTWAGHAAVLRQRRADVKGRPHEQCLRVGMSQRLQQLVDRRRCLWECQRRSDAIVEMMVVTEASKRPRNPTHFTASANMQTVHHL